jgi:hypothetical protein
MEIIFGRDLRSGDVLNVWWVRGHGAAIVDFLPYTVHPAHADILPQGARIGVFSGGQTMTLPNHTGHPVLQRLSAAQQEPANA